VLPMRDPEPKQILLSFIKRINDHDAEGVAALMTDDHVFIDSLGRAMRGRIEMRRAWESYFWLFPDYRIVSEEIFESSGVFAILGRASGTYCAGGEMLAENRWEIPAAWRAVIRVDRVAEWRVFADNYQTVKLIENSTGSSNTQ
jgi:ketosteroid isomerase-like protein